jgi:ABC-type enterochelin transport system permease subunit
MRDDKRADLEAESLLRIVLVLVVVWLVLEIVGEFVGIATALVGPFRPVLGLLVVAVIVLWLLDRI